MGETEFLAGSGVGECPRCGSTAVSARWEEIGEGSDAMFLRARCEKCRWRRTLPGFTTARALEIRRRSERAVRGYLERGDEESARRVALTGAMLIRRAEVGG